MKSTSNKKRFSFLRFGMRFLLLLILLTACVLGWVSWKIEAAKTELQLARKLQSAGCRVEWSHWDNGAISWPEPGWNEQWLRNHMFSHLKCVGFNNEEVKSLELFLPLKHLTELRVNCPLLTDIETLREFPNLESLVIRNCDSLTNIDVIGQCKKLKTLEIFKCESVEDISFITHLENLEQLELEYLPHPRVAENTFANVCKLKKLHIEGVPSISNLDQFAASPSLEKVSLQIMDALENIDGLKRNARASRT